MVVIDPGAWSEPEALTGADAVLVTHEHGDHVDRTLLARFSGDVYAPTGANDLAALAPIRLGVDTAVDLGGVTVEAVGGRHAHVVEGQRVCVNLGYIVDGLVYHPGDALHVPDQAIDTLFVPLQASWLKTAEAIDFVRAVAPRQAIGMHEGQVNERGLAALNHWLSTACAGVYRWLAPGDSVEIGPR